MRKKHLPVFVETSNKDQKGLSHWSSGSGQWRRNCLGTVSHNEGEDHFLVCRGETQVRYFEPQAIFPPISGITWSYSFAVTDWMLHSCYSTLIFLQLMFQILKAVFPSGQGKTAEFLWLWAEHKNCWQYILWAIRPLIHVSGEVGCVTSQYPFWYYFLQFIQFL